MIFNPQVTKNHSNNQLEQAENLKTAMVYHLQDPTAVQSRGKQLKPIF